MADVYIYPGSAYNGDGTSGDTATSPGGAGAKNTWVGLSWSAGNRYLQRRGSQFATASGSSGRISVGVTGTAGAPIYIGCYGDPSYPAPLINSLADATFNFTGRSYVTLEDFDVYGAPVISSQSNSTSGAMTNVTLRRVRSYNSSDVGFLAMSGLDGARVTNFLIDRCEAYNSKNHGFIVAGDIDAIVQKCIADGSGWGVGAHGISCHPNRTTYTPSWTNTSGNIYSTAVGSQTYQTTVTDLYGVRYVNTSITLTKNTSTPTTPGLNEYGFSAGTLYINIGGVPSGQVTIAYTSTFLQAIGNQVRNVVNFAGAEGTGIQFDDLASGGMAYGNLIENCDGFGVQCYAGRSNKVVNNIINGCGSHGLYLSNGGATLNEAYFNTIIGGVNGPSSTGAILGAGNTAKNNVIVGYGTGVNGTSTSAEDYNDIFGASTVRTGGIATGSKTIAVDPMLISSHRLLPGSPLLGAGTPISGITRDFDGKWRRNPPAIGAFDQATFRHS